MEDVRYIDVLSDSTGETAEKVVRAALLQFPRSGAAIRLHTRVRTKDQARAVLERTAQQGALLVFTVVSPELREFVHGMTDGTEGRSDRCHVGSLIGKLGTYLDREPINMPSAMLPLSDEYFRRIESVEFAVKSDDGKDPRNFRRADLILVGVSRTSKTPLSLILAQRGLKVANLPLVLGVSLPYEIREAPPEKVVGLTIGLEQLCEIRQARLKQLGMPIETNYGMRASTFSEEIDYAASVFKEHGWPYVDVTEERAIEETAVIVLEKMKERGEHIALAGRA